MSPPRCSPSTDAKALKTPRRSKPPHKPQPPPSVDILRREAAPSPPSTTGHASAASRKTSSLIRVGLLKPHRPLHMWASRQLRLEGRVVDLAPASLSERRSCQKRRYKVEDVEETRIGKRRGLWNLIQRYQLPSALDEPHLELPCPLDGRGLCNEGVEYRHKLAGDLVGPSEQ